MPFKGFKRYINWHSLRARIAVGVLLAVIVSLWSAAFLISQTLRQDMEAAIAAQQYSTVSLLAREVDRSIRERKVVVESLAVVFSSGMVEHPARLQKYLEENVVLPLMFNWGIVVTDRQGIVIASVPASLKRIGLFYGDQPFFQKLFSEGVTQITEPKIGRHTGQPVTSVVTPIRSGDGKLIGSIFGVTNLATPNFLDEINSSKYGKTGDFLLTSPDSRLFISSSDKRRVMKQGPPPGVNVLYDRYLAGYEGSGVALSSRGVVELSSSVRIPSTGWLVQSVLPAEEAFAPIGDMQIRLVFISLCLTLFAGGIAWWWLRWQFAPLEEAATLLGKMRDGILPRQALPVSRDDETGALATAFNGLLEVIAAEELVAAEHAANQRLRKIVSQVPGVVFQYRLHADGTGSFPFVSDAVRDIFGLTPDELEFSASAMRAMLYPGDAARFFASIQASAADLSPWRIEYRVTPIPGCIKWVLVDAVPDRTADGSITWFGFIADMTESKAMESELRIAATTFDCQEGIFITDAHSRIIRVNRAFTTMTGYESAEALGHTPALLKSGRHGAPFYRSMWSALAEKGYWRGEIWNRRKNGEIFAAWATITAVRDGDGKTTHYVAVFTDISEYKQIEEEVRRLAFYDPLTSLPNRRLFIDRLDQTLAGMNRSQRCGALLFLDLDQFKELNDRDGHIMGDKLLLEVAQRLTQCVRASDTVARLGGDEFVVLLQELGSVGSCAVEAAAEAGVVAEKIRVALAEPYVLQANPEPAGQAPVVHCCSASIGIAIFGEAPCARDELIRRADVAMYDAKAAGRNTIRFFGRQPSNPLLPSPS